MESFGTFTRNNLQKFDLFALLLDYQLDSMELLFLYTNSFGDLGF